MNDFRKNHKGILLTINDWVTGQVWIKLFSGQEANPLMEVTNSKCPQAFYEQNTYYNG